MKRRETHDSSGELDTTNPAAGREVRRVYGRVRRAGRTVADNGHVKRHTYVEPTRKNPHLGPTLSVEGEGM